MSKGKSSKPSVNDTRELLENENYKKFYEDKQKLKEKYHEWLFENPARVRKERKEWYLHKGGQEQWREYLKELGDLMFKPKSDFQEFTWEMISEHEQLQIKRRLKTKSHYTY